MRAERSNSGQQHRQRQRVTHESRLHLQLEEPHERNRHHERQGELVVAFDEAIRRTPHPWAPPVTIVKMPPFTP